MNFYCTHSERFSVFGKLPMLQQQLLLNHIETLSLVAAQLNKQQKSDAIGIEL